MLNFKCSIAWNPSIFLIQLFNRRSTIKYENALLTTWNEMFQFYFIIKLLELRSAHSKFPMLWNKLTDLNAPRLHDKLPKHSKTISCCANNIIIGSNRCTSIEYECQSNWMITLSNLSNSLLILWHNSQITNIVPNE